MKVLRFNGVPFFLPGFGQGNVEKFHMTSLHGAVQG